MGSSQFQLHYVAAQLPAQHLKEVLDFAEFLAYKNNNGVRQSNRRPSRLKHLEIPSMKDVKFIGDPLLRREDIYDDWGR